MDHKTNATPTNYSLDNIHQTIQSIVIVRSIGPHQQHAVLKGQPCLAALLVPATSKVRDGATFGLPIERLFHELDLT